MSESTNKWNITGSRVYSNGEGKSFNLMNKITAQTLYNTLNEYETKILHLEKQINTTKNYEKIQQQLIALQMDISNAQSDLNKIKELL